MEREEGKAGKCVRCKPSAECFKKREPSGQVQVTQVRWQLRLNLRYSNEEPIVKLATADVVEWWKCWQVKKASHKGLHIGWLCFYDTYNIGKSIETESILVVTKDWGDLGSQRMSDYKISTWIMTVLELGTAVGGTALWMHLTLLNLHFKVVMMVCFVLCASYHNKF
jgi:hypothetical protein